jgi:hypothetical protein
MKRKRRTPEQIIVLLRDAEANLTDDRYVFGQTHLVVG